MSNTDKSKLDGVAANANNYSHPTGDGNLHVPATGTTNSGKVLTAGSTAGSLSWTDLPEPYVPVVDPVYELISGKSSFIGISAYDLDIINPNTYLSVKYNITINTSSKFQTLELLLVHNGSTVEHVEYADVRLGTTPPENLATFTSIISSGQLKLIITPTNNNTTVRFTGLRMKY